MNNLCQPHFRYNTSHDVLDGSNGLVSNVRTEDYEENEFTVHWNDLKCVQRQQRVMECVPLGSTGTKVSELCFGTWRFGHESGGVVETTREEAHALLDVAQRFSDEKTEFG